MIAVLGFGPDGDCMIDSVQFRNLKALRDTTLPLGRFTLIIGPNGSGKSTALWALRAAGNTGLLDFNKIATVDLPVDSSTTVEVVLHWGKPYDGVMTYARWLVNRQSRWHTNFKQG